jgi:hypothetical protein
MRRLIIVATIGLAFACLAGGCTGSVQQPPAPLGGPSPNRGGPSLSSATVATPGPTTNAELSSSRISAAITTAAAQATALHLTGTFISVGAHLTTDSHLNRDGTSSGTLTYMGATIPFLVSGKAEYFQLTPTFMTLVKLTRSSAEGKWVTAESSYGQELSTLFAQFITFKGFVDTDMTFAPSGTTFTSEKPDHIGAQPVAVYREQAASGSVYTFDIAASGPALPLKITGGDSNNGANAELAWNQPTAVTLPSPAQVYTG